MEPRRRSIALFAASALLLLAVWWRGEHHPAPVLEPAMLRVRSFGLAVSGSLVFFAGFGAMLLAGRALPHDGLARERPRSRD